jgi:hypothetical protein
MTHSQEIPKRWSHAIAVYWAMLWRMSIGFFALLIPVILLSEWLFPFSMPAQQSVQMWATGIVMPLLGVYATRAVMNKNFGRFRVALVPAVKKGKQAEDAADNDAAQQPQNEK